MKKSTKNYFMITSIVIASLTMVIFVSTWNQNRYSSTHKSTVMERSPDRQLDSADKELLKTCQRDNLLRIDIQLKRAFVHAALWTQMTAQQKEGFGYILAVHITNARGESTYWCNIFDMYSGKKIAKYSTLWGLEVY